MFIIKGKLIVANSEQVISEKFKKRDFVIETEDDRYPQKLSFQLVQDKCDVLDKYNIGDEIEVYFNLKGRDWTNPQGEVKYFNTLEAWRIENAGGDNTSTPSIPDLSNVNDNDLPF